MCDARTLNPNQNIVDLKPFGMDQRNESEAFFVKLFTLSSYETEIIFPANFKERVTHFQISAICR